MAMDVNKKYTPPNPAQCIAVPIEERRNCVATNDTGQQECQL